MTSAWIAKASCLAKSSGGLLPVLHAAAGAGDFRAGFREPLGERDAQAGAGPRHDRDLAGQVEQLWMVLAVIVDAPTAW